MAWLDWFIKRIFIRPDASNAMRTEADEIRYEERKVLGPLGDANADRNGGNTAALQAALTLPRRAPPVGGAILMASALWRRHTLGRERQRASVTADGARMPLVCLAAEGRTTLLQPPRRIFRIFLSARSAQRELPFKKELLIMKYMKLYGSIGLGEHADVDRLRRRIERYRRALRRCARRRRQEREMGVATKAVTVDHVLRSRAAVTDPQALRVIT